MMKRYIYCILSAMSALFLAGCGKDTPAAVDSGIVGEWHLTSWSGEAPAGDFDVYISFAAGGTFDLYQRVETSVYVRYSGSFSADNGTVSGTYSDGEHWATDYSYTLDNGTLTMTAVTGGEVSIYTREAVPDEVRASGDAHVKSLSGSIERFL